MEKISLAVGPSLKQINGQSIHYNWVKEKILKNSISLDYSLYPATFDILYFLARLIYYRFFKLYNQIYFTPTRSRFGYLRDIILLHFLQKKNVRVIAHLHGNEFNLFFNSLTKYEKIILRASYRRVNLVIALSEEIKNFLINVLHVKAIYLPNALPGEEKIEKEIQKIDSYPLTILWFSNIMFSKGIFNFLEAIRFLDARMIRIRIAGNFLSDDFASVSEVRSRFDICMHDLKSIGYNIEYLGVVTGDDKKKIYQDSHIFVLPTFYKTEAMPLSVLEAINNECIVILSDWLFLKEVFTDYKIYFHRYNDIKDLYLKIQEAVLGYFNIKSQEIMRKNREKLTSINKDAIISLKHILNGEA